MPPTDRETGMTYRNRLLVLAVAVAVLAVVAVASVLHAAHRADRENQAQQGGPPVTAGHVSLAASAQRLMVFRNMAWGSHRDELATVPAASPGARRTASGVKCLRFYAAAGTGICLQAVHGPVQDSYRAVVLDSHLHELRHFPLAGIPTRARVSPSGRMVAWTVFVSGDSYAGTAFSTRTSILDTHTWQLQSSLEPYAVTKDGRSYRAADINYWGVTFADDTNFYATLATGGRTYLVRGDATARTVRTLRENAECPSLSPDGTRLVFKKRVKGASPDAPWRLYALDLHTMRETPLAEHRSVDDQVVWSDTHTVVYALAGDFGTDLWTVPADGTGTARRLAMAALAPAYVGQAPAGS
jgi:hypothetical protein